MSVAETGALEVHPFLRHRDPVLEHIASLELDILRTRREHARIATRHLARQQFQA